jgi:hypothetical protein
MRWRSIQAMMAAAVSSGVPLLVGQPGLGDSVGDGEPRVKECGPDDRLAAASQGGEPLGEEGPFGLVGGQFKTTGRYADRS